MKHLVIVLLIVAILVVGLNTIADAGRNSIVQRVADLEQTVDRLEAQNIQQDWMIAFLKNHVGWLCEQHGCVWYTARIGDQP